MFRLSRFLVFALMLVLLPLRGWASNVTAINMAATAVVQAKMYIMTSQPSMPADCDMHAQPSTKNAAPYCSNCDTCEMCLALANLTFATLTDIQQIPPSTSLDFDARFSNAVRALNLKPPIS